MYLMPAALKYYTIFKTYHLLQTTVWNYKAAFAYPSLQKLTLVHACTAWLKMHLTVKSNGKIIQGASHNNSMFGPIGVSEEINDCQHGWLGWANVETKPTYSILINSTKKNKKVFIDKRFILQQNLKLSQPFLKFN